MSYYFPSNCDTLPEHTYDPCEDKEYGRIRSVGFIHVDYALMPSIRESWQAGVNGGKIILIPETNGESPKASPATAPAYGRRPESVIGYTFTASYTDPNYTSNCNFYNHVIGNMNYRFFFRTSSHIYMTSTPVSITPNRDIKNDMTAEVTRIVDIKWLDRQFPCALAAPSGIFDLVPDHSTVPGGGTTVPVNPGGGAPKG